MKILRGHTNYVFCVNYNPAGSLLVSGSFDESVRIWDVSRGARLDLKAVFSSCPSRQMHEVVARALGSRYCCALQSRWHHDCILCIGWAHVRAIFPCGSADESDCSRIWDTTSGQCLKTIVDDDNPQWCLFCITIIRC